MAYNDKDFDDLNLDADFNTSSVYGADDPFASAANVFNDKDNLTKDYNQLEESFKDLSAGFAKIPEGKWGPFRAIARWRKKLSGRDMQSNAKNILTRYERMVTNAQKQVGNLEKTVMSQEATVKKYEDAKVTILKASKKVEKDLEAAKTDYEKVDELYTALRTALDNGEEILDDNGEKYDRSHLAQYEAMRGTCLRKYESLQNKLDGLERKTEETETMRLLTQQTVKRNREQLKSFKEQRDDSATTYKIVEHNLGEIIRGIEQLIERGRLYQGTLTIKRINETVNVTHANYAKEISRQHAESQQHFLISPEGMDKIASADDDSVKLLEEGKKNARVARQNRLKFLQQVDQRNNERVLEAGPSEDGKKSLPGPSSHDDALRRKLGLEGKVSKDDDE